MAFGTTACCGSWSQSNVRKPSRSRPHTGRLPDDFRTTSGHWTQQPIQRHKHHQHNQHNQHNRCVLLNAVLAIVLITMAFWNHSMLWLMVADQCPETVRKSSAYRTTSGRFPAAGEPHGLPARKNRGGRPLGRPAKKRAASRADCCCRHYKRSGDPPVPPLLEPNRPVPTAA